MKKTLIAILLVALVGPVFAQVNVQKVSGTNAITGNLVFPTGKTLTMDSGSTLTVNGTISTSGSFTVGGTFIGVGALNAFNTAAGITPFTELEVDSTSTGTPRGVMSAQFNTGTDGARFHMRKARGTRASPTTVVTGDNLGRLVATGYDGTGYLEMGSILFGTEGTIATNRIPTNMSFWTATNANPSVLTQRLLIDSAGLATFSGNLTVQGTGTSTIGSGTSGDLRVYGILSIDNGTGGVKLLASSTTGIIRSVGGDLSFRDNNNVALLGLTATSGNAAVTGNLTVSGTGLQTIGGAASTVRMPGYGAGAATFDSSGNITSVSDARMKDIGAAFTTGLDAVRKLTPKFYHWKKESGLNTDDVNVSLIAQDLIAAGIPEAVFTQRTLDVTEEFTEEIETDVETGIRDANGLELTEKRKVQRVAVRPKIGVDGNVVTKRVDSAIYTVSDRAVIAALVNAIKDLADQNDALAARVSKLEAR